MSQLDGKVALITGGSRGIGKAIAEVFAREGATAVICGRKQPSLDAVAAELANLPGKVVPIACHVGKAEDLAALVDRVHKEFGKIDILVNNAATNVSQGPCLATDDGQFDKMIEINLKSAFRLTRLVAPGMCERGWGSIINIASIAGLRPQFEGMMYSVTKAALIMMTKSYALELGLKGVRRQRDRAPADPDGAQRVLLEGPAEARQAPRPAAGDRRNRSPAGRRASSSPAAVCCYSGEMRLLRGGAS